MYVRAFRSAALFTLALILGWPATAQAQARPPVCTELEARLVALSRPERGLSTQAHRLEEAIRRQAGALRQTEADARRMGCQQRGGFFFQPPRPAACRQYDKALDDMRRNLDALQRQLAGTARPAQDGDRERGRLLGELALNGCGPQYARFLPGQRERGRGLFGSLFGGDGGERYVTQSEAPQTGTYRTVCVRKCDGFFWPVSFSTIPGNFSADEAACRSSCPGMDVGLYTYRRPGGSLEEAVTPQGEPYGRLENAYLFRSKFVEDCHCPSPQMQTAGAGMDRIAATLFPQRFKTAEASVPLPARRPDRFDIGLFENPYGEAKPAATAPVAGGGLPVTRAVRVVGPQFVYARSAEEADAARDRKVER